MHILYIHQYFATLSNSSGTRSYEFARRLVQSGHEVTMLTSNSNLQLLFREGEDEIRETSVDGIRVLVINESVNNRTSFGKRLTSFSSFARKATRLGMKVSCDCVFATSTPLTVAYPALRISKTKKIPMIFEVRDIWPDVPIELGIIKNPILKWLSRRLEMKAYKFAKRIIALSFDMKNNIVGKGIPADKIVVIPNASDNEIFDSVSSVELEKFQEEYPIFRERKVVLYAGTIGMVNGLKYMVELAAEAIKHSQKVAFVIIGDGREREEVIGYAKSLKVFDRNLFVFPPMPKNRVICAMKAATIHTSFVINKEVLWANSANKFFDALAASKPIVINYGGWQSEVLMENDAGILLPPDSPVEGARRILELINNWTKYHNMCENAKRIAVTLYDRNTLFKRLDNVITESSNS
ncbi:Glycosyl transferase, group 1 [Mesotoga infera]|uniref:Glycosyl transferase, group 1 n=1 Tax=Mesotoga infera TaxID=1236046 RepID=A0A7Z7LDR3_9BACT|nr:glycosyltransferase family 4 protein [Mesotoga infera]SSC12124.1 Glycosyl transferase, group 1 [Mesotoga infera]